MSGVPNIINDTQAYVLRNTGHHNLDTGLLAVPPSFSSARFNPTTGKVETRKQRNGIRFRRFELLNAAAAAAGGIGFRFDDTYLRIGVLSEDGATMVDVSDLVKSRTPQAVQEAGALQTGFVIGYPVPFGWVSTVVSTAEEDAGGAAVPDHAVQYSQNGTTWATTTAGSAYKDDFTKTNTVWAAEIKNFVWAPPADWAPNTTLMTEWQGLYLMRFTSADREADDVAALITGLEVGTLVKVTSIAQNGIWENESSDFSSSYADGVVAFFATAAAGNRVYAEWETF